MPADSRVVIKVKRLVSEAVIPQYEHPGDSGADIVAITECVLQPLQRAVMDTGLSAELPAGFEIQVRPKSSLAKNHGITVLNTPGTIDSGYRGEIRVILINLGSEPFYIHRGQKIAQLVLSPIVRAAFEEADELSGSGRGSSGFGSTGAAFVEESDTE